MQRLLPFSEGNRRLGNEEFGHAWRGCIPFLLCLSVTVGKKDLAGVQRTKVKKALFPFFPPTFSVLISKYEIMRTSFLLVAHDFACFLFWPPAQMTF